MITVNTKTFVKELEWTCEFIKGRTTIPILMNALIQNSPGGITLIGTDLELGAIGFVEATGEISPTTFPARAALKYLKRIEEPELRLEIGDKQSLVISHGDNACITFAGMSTDSFPELPSPKPGGQVFELGGLLKAIPRIRISISKEENRFTLNAALLSIEGKKAVMVATDGHRLSCHKVSASKDLTPLKALIPDSVLARLQKLKLDSFMVTNQKDYLFFDFAKRRILTRKTTGNFPDYRRVLPAKFGYAAIVDTAALTKALKQVGVMADERSHAIKWTINSKIGLGAGAEERGFATSSVPLTYKGAPYPGDMETGFKDYLVLEALALMPEKCLFRFTDSESAAEFDTPSWRYLVMPLRMNESRVCQPPEPPAANQGGEPQ